MTLLSALLSLSSGCVLSSTVSEPPPPVSPWPNSTVDWKLPVRSVLVHDVEMRQGTLLRRGLMITRILADTSIDGDPASVASVVGYFTDSGTASIWSEGATAVYAYHPEGIVEYDRKDYWPDLYPAGLFRQAARAVDTANFGYAANLLAYPMARPSSWEGIDTNFILGISQIDFRLLDDTLIRTGEGTSLCLGIRGRYRSGNVVFDRWIDKSGLARSRYDWTSYFTTDGGTSLDSVRGWAVAVRVSTDSNLVDTLRAEFFQRVFAGN